MQRINSSALIHFCQFNYNIGNIWDFNHTRFFCRIRRGVSADIHSAPSMRREYVSFLHPVFKKYMNASVQYIDFIFKIKYNVI